MCDRTVSSKQQDRADVRHVQSVQPNRAANYRGGHMTICTVCGFATEFPITVLISAIYAPFTAGTNLCCVPKAMTVVTSTNYVTTDDTLMTADVQAFH